MTACARTNEILLFFQITPAQLDETEEEVFVRLQILERGQYFGVTDFVFADQPSLILISNGAECMMVAKKFYLKFASENCLRRLRKTEVPYPSAQELGRKLEEFWTWQRRKQHIMKDSLQAAESRKELKAALKKPAH